MLDVGIGLGGREGVDARLGAADALEVGGEGRADQPVRGGERRPVGELPGRRVVVDQIALRRAVLPALPSMV